MTYQVTYSNPSRGNRVIGTVETLAQAEKLARANGGRKDKRNAPDCMSVTGEPSSGIWIELMGLDHQGHK